ncbi:Glucomannan 4-beta-mannosyltransferase 9 [Dendrobium catenatum]|uniref:Glucomannan 4-beta-mannosyltransferase 9 n=1 Tax=Dendrobium catenatum TaxID=906689 RepID=A0A2I0W4E1_9ASPA|nr:Glucomannan 4-beta-mannosyltransferase 9 [Dendrobium catenatum]
MECERWASKGINIRYEIRANKNGYKAGALKEGMKHSYVSNCDFDAIFDADFQPEADFLCHTNGGEKIELKDNCNVTTFLRNELMVQECAIPHGLDPFVYVSNGLVNMNARCGDIKSFVLEKASEVGCENDLHRRHLSCTDLFKEPSKYAWSNFCDDHFIVSYQRIVLVTSKRVMLLQPLSLDKLDRKPSKIGWDVPCEELLALELAKASPSFVIGKPLNDIISIRKL